MEKEIEIRAKKNESYKLIIKLELNEEDEKLLKKRFNLLALLPRLDNDQNKVIETLFGDYWYKDCEINVIRQYE